jgi:hypothetical protein
VIFSHEGNPGGAGVFGMRRKLLGGLPSSVSLPLRVGGLGSSRCSLAFALLEEALLAQHRTASLVYRSWLEGDLAWLAAFRAHRVVHLARCEAVSLALVTAGLAALREVQVAGGVKLLLTL